MNNELLKTLKTLSESDGISGNEKKVAKTVAALSQGFVDKIEYDNLGSVITIKGNKGPKILVGAHLDEIGLMVTKITKDGFIKFQTIGGWFSQVMLAQRWHIHTKDGKKVLAVTGCKPPHLIPLDQRSKAIEIETMYLDIGSTSYDEVLSLGIEPGCMVVPVSSFETLVNKDYVLGKALDNRVGSLIVLEVMKKISTTDKQVYGVHTVQEEVGLRGAKTTGYKVNPDIAIAIDTGVGNDVPGGDAENQSLGKGPQIVLYDAGLIAHPKLRSFVKSVAKEVGIAYQEVYLTRGQTDAAAFSLAHEGAPSIAICVPTRYMHCHTGIINLVDINNTINLVVEVINRLNQSVINDITFD